MTPFKRKTTNVRFSDGSKMTVDREDKTIKIGKTTVVLDQLGYMVSKVKEGQRFIVELVDGEIKFRRL